MTNVELVIKIPEESYVALMEIKDTLQKMQEFEKFIANGILLPKGHGRLVDIGKIDKDRIESNNPVISLMIDGECIEAVSLDYLDNLSTIVEAESEG